MDFLAGENMKTSQKHKLSTSRPECQEEKKGILFSGNSKVREN